MFSKVALYVSIKLKFKKWIMYTRNFIKNKNLCCIIQPCGQFILEFYSFILKLFLLFSSEYKVLLEEKVMHVLISRQNQIQGGFVSYRKWWYRKLQQQQAKFSSAICSFTCNFIMLLRFGFVLFICTFSILMKPIQLRQSSDCEQLPCWQAFSCQQATANQGVLFMLQESKR